MPAICRDCESAFEQANRCPECLSPRIVAHRELHTLAIAHLDCDAFYASVEKRDNPEILYQPVIVGGSKRGVVSTACYIARIRGVHSAMPMFKAMRICPEAVIVEPNFDKYVEASRQIRELMETLTPAVEPLSLDEAFLDLRGTRRFHGVSPATLLVRLANRIEREVGVSGSIGLSHNKFLAKMASDMDKPRGFAVVGKEETREFLSDLPVGLIWGVGPALGKQLDQIGIRTFKDLRRWDRRDLQVKFGDFGDRLWKFSRGEDSRTIKSNRSVKSISSETTFIENTSNRELLDGHIWRLSEKVADRAKANNRCGKIVILKVKRSNHSSVSRRITLSEPTQMAERIYKNAKELFDSLDDIGSLRLIGVGLSAISESENKIHEPDLLEPDLARQMRVERATDEIRNKFGKKAILKGRSLR